jgi:hypothetical protein
MSDAASEKHFPRPRSFQHGNHPDFGAATEVRGSRSAMVNSDVDTCLRSLLYANRPDFGAATKLRGSRSAMVNSDVDMQLKNACKLLMENMAHIDSRNIKLYNRLDELEATLIDHALEIQLQIRDLSRPPSNDHALEIQPRGRTDMHDQKPVVELSKRNGRHDSLPVELDDLKIEEPCDQIDRGGSRLSLSSDGSKYFAGHPRFLPKEEKDTAVNGHRDALKRHLQREKQKLEKGSFGTQVIHTVSHPSMPKAPQTFREFVEGKSFTHFCTIMILLYTVLVGVEAEFEIRAGLDQEHTPAWVQWATTAVNIWFVVEIVIRIAAEGVVYFCGRDHIWNWFDFLLVALSVVEIAGMGFSLGFLRIFRTVKVARAFRAIRVLRFFAELRIMVATIITSFMALFWSLVFLFVITYLAAVVFLKGAAVYLKTGEVDAETRKNIEANYTSLSRVFYMLLAVATGGTDWVQLAEPLWVMGWLYGLGFLIFILSSSIFIMNIITGIFVENAVNITKIDRDCATSRHMWMMEENVKDLIALYNLMDSEGYGQVSLERLKSFFEDPHVNATFAVMDIDVTDCFGLESYFDNDDKGYVTQGDFVIACLSIRGVVKRTDIKMTDLTTSKHLSCIEEHIIRVEEHFCGL